MQQTPGGDAMSDSTVTLDPAPVPPITEAQAQAAARTVAAHALNAAEAAIQRVRHACQPKERVEPDPEMLFSWAHTMGWNEALKEVSKALRGDA
jgi:hypothetical protein